VGISILNLQYAAHLITDTKYSVPQHFHLIAASTFYGIKNSKPLQESLNSGVNFCDSKPLSSWITLRGIDCPQIRGTDLLREVLRICDSKVGHFFIGTTNENLSKLVSTISEEYSHIKISGKFAPPFSMPTEAELSEWGFLIQQSKAEIVWLSLGSPKQDIVAAQLSKLVSAKIVAVGAAFDFFSKSKAEAPVFVQKIHLEWLFRFIKEPRRLWKRYTVGIAYFAYLVIKDLTVRSSTKYIKTSVE
jgi:N-acetylglucosaminyldiphosphoundecaprenol N-acetyl-beta-D-mannosaminyltransferase